MEKKKHLNYFGQRIKSDIPLFVIMVVFLAFFLGSGIYFAVIGQSRNATMSFAFSLIIPAFYIIEWLLRVKVHVVFAVILMLFSAGTIIGACYDVYTYFIYFDTILHGMWGVVLTVIGFVLIKKFIGEPTDTKSFFACLFAGFLFSLATALLWELFEYLGYLVGGYDMQEDVVINEFYSYWLSEGHLHIKPEHINDITQTIIYYDNGEKTLVIDGYLELGVIDTITDMAWCFFCSVIFFVIMTLDRFLLKGRLCGWLVPVLVKREEKSTEDEPEQLTLDEAVLSDGQQSEEDEP